MMTHDQPPTRRNRRKDATGSITKRADGRYMIRITTPGGHRVTRYARRKADAERILAELRTDVIRNEERYEVAPADRITVREYASHSFKERLDGLVGAGHIRPRHADETIRLLDRYVLDVIGDVKLVDVRPRHADAVLAGMSSTAKSDSTRRNTIGALRKLLSVAAEDGIIPKSTVADIERPDRRRGRREPVSLTVEQRAALADRLHDEWDRAHDDRAVLALLALYTGARRGEVVGVKWSDLDLTARRWHLTRSVVETPKKGWHEAPPKSEHGTRTVQIAPELVQVLREHKMRSADTSSWVVHRPGPRPLNATVLYHYVVPHLRAVGAPTGGLHVLRHSFAFAALGGKRSADDAKLAHVSRAMGHGDITVTVNLYGKTDPEAVADVFEAAAPRRSRAATDS